MRELLAAATLVTLVASVVPGHPATAAGPGLAPTSDSTTGVPLLRLPGGFTTVRAINGDNWVVGGNAGQAVLWRGGDAVEAIPRPTSAWNSMEALGLNDAGQVVGTWGDAAFRWEEASGTTIVPTPPRRSSTFLPYRAQDIDDQGNILVSYERDNHYCGSGASLAGATAILDSAGDYEELVPDDCWLEVTGRAIGSATVVGHISSRPADATGTGPFTWSDGSFGTLSGRGVNDVAGEYIAGWNFTDGATMATRLQRGGAPLELGTLGGVSSTSTAVNSLGTVVGSADTADGDRHAFLWRPEIGMVDLGTLGGTTSFAVAINDQGNVLGKAATADGGMWPVVWITGGAPNDPQADLVASLTITSGDEDEDGIVSHGSRVGYRATVSNLGPDPSAGGELVVSLPAGTEGSSISDVAPGCVFDGSDPTAPTLRCPGHPLEAGTAAAAVDFSVQMPGEERETFTVQALATEGSAQDPDAANNAASVTITIVPPDGDGIADPVDGRFADPNFIGEARVPSVNFTDQHLGGTTFGSFVDPPRGTVRVEDSLDPVLGLTFSTTQTLEAVALRMCDEEFAVRVLAGSEVVMSCGSITVGVLTGITEVELSDGAVASIGAGATARIVDDGAGIWDVDVLSGSDVRVTPADDGTPPLADAGGSYIGEVGTLIELDGSGSTGAGDLTYSWSSDGGVFSDPSSASPTFTSPDAGVHAATLEVCDLDARCSTAATTIVVYDPDAGFVTGGGWLVSPAGACRTTSTFSECEGPTTGKTKFEIAARYGRGAAVPDGNVTFELEGGGFRFQSTSLDWLVVPGTTRAHVHGSGEVNGRPGYRFTATAHDGPEEGLRMLITWEGDVVYDNLPAGGSSDDDTPKISRGRIVVHTRGR